MFAPDGFENYKQALQYKIIKDSFPLMNLKGVIKSKTAANRPKDKAMLPSLRDFNNFLRNKKETIDTQNLFYVPSGYEVADVQTLQRWALNEARTIKEKLSRGIK